MITELKKIAPLVKRQFPAFYAEEGQNFLQFVKAYYEWLDENSGGKIRNLLETTDVDETSSDFLSHFSNKYMHGIPESILSNKRFLVKHIQDVYRSKGSIEGLKLLFRIIYNEEIDVYVPAVDILKPSDSTWLKRKYLQVNHSSKHFDYDNQYIRGTSSGATAYVTTAAKLFLNNDIVYVLYLSDDNVGPTGSTFRIGEMIIYDGLDPADATTIIGSPVSAVVNGSTEDNLPGDILQVQNSYTSGTGTKFNIASVIDPNIGQGFVTFRIKNGGYGYSLSANIQITAGTNTTGSGATFKIGSLKNTSQFQYNTNIIDPQGAVLINASNYGANMNFASYSSTIDDALTYATTTIGSIASLVGVTSGDKNYNGNVSVSVIDHKTYGYNLGDGFGGIIGGDAWIDGSYATGNGIVKSVTLLASGYGFNTQGERLEFFNESNNALTADLTVSLGGVGIEQGEWVTTKGFLNSDKYIQDSYYYQEYSYEIRISKSLDKYIQVLKQLGHPVGNKQFGRTIIADSLSTPITSDAFSVTTFT